MCGPDKTIHPKKARHLPGFFCLEDTQNNNLMRWYSYPRENDYRLAFAQRGSIIFRNGVISL